jgi:ATP-dependent Clp protease ATP-binding subunit ClpA
MMRFLNGYAGFAAVSGEVQREIGNIAICEELARFNDRGINLTISEEVFGFLFRRGIQKTLGAHAPLGGRSRRSSETQSQMP